MALIKQYLQKSESEIERIKVDPFQQGDVFEIYIREGLVYADLSAVGAVDPVTTENYFQKGMSAHSAVGTQVTFENYYYAAFLAQQFGASRIADIRNLLSAYSAKNSENIHRAVPAFFLNARSDESLNAMKISLKVIGSN